MATKHPRKPGTGIASLSLQIADRTGKEVQLLPAGKFKSVDGRPASITKSKCSEWVMDGEAAQALIAAASARQNAAVIDYEHQTLTKEQNGQPAPAAGWFKDLEWRDGVGLFGVNVEWTPRAAQAIKDGEYRYISPVILFDENTGRVTALMMAALTNYAGIDGMQPASLAAMNAAFFNDDEIEEPHMNKTLAALLAALGLTSEATDDQALTALNAFVAKSQEATSKVTALTVDLAAAQKATTPDPAKFVPIEAVTAMQTQLSALSAKITGGEVDTIVTAALTAGKLLPAQEAWARELGGKDVAALKSFLAVAPAIAALAGSQTQGQAPINKETGLTAEQLSVCTAMGIKPEDFKKSLPAA